MATEIEALRVLVVSKDSSLIGSTRKALAKNKSYSFLNNKISEKEYASEIAEIEPDVLLLDYTFLEDAYSYLANFTIEHASSAIVVVLPDSADADADRLLLSGARETLEYPFQPDDLEMAIDRAVERQQRNMPHVSSAWSEEEGERPSQVVTVFSPKGGVATTTTAVNIAISLYRILKEDVLVIDGKHLFGHLALYCNLRTSNSITDLTAHAGNLDEHLIKQVVVKHTSGIYVLPSPSAIAKAQGIKPDALFKVIQSLQREFPYIIIDGGSFLDENTVTYMDSSQKILLILNPDIASMRDIRQFMDVSTTLSYPREKMLLILNLAGRKGDVKREEVERILKMNIFGKVPADVNLAQTCLNEGVPVVVKKPHHPISKAYGDIAKDLLKVLKTSLSDRKGK